MGDKSEIQWTDRTWNPWQGCAHVSPGCDHCYMFRDMRRYGKDPDVVRRSSAQTFNKPLRWEREAQAGDPKRLVFLASWSDFFIREADPWRAEAWDIIRRCPSLTFQILTKRHARIADALPDDWGDGYPNVALGVTCEDQEWMARRWQVLREIPARWRFVSHEPALGPVVLESFATGMHPLPDWVITGGESGKGARPYDLAWARSLIAEGRRLGVPIFVKQLGARLTGTWDPDAGKILTPQRLRDPHGGDMDEWPESIRVRQFPADWRRDV